MGKKNNTKINKSKKDRKYMQRIQANKKSQSKRNIRGINRKKKSYRYKEILNIFREPTVIEMINNLDSQTGPLQTNQIDSTVKLEFGSNINYREYDTSKSGTVNIKLKKILLNNVKTLTIFFFC